MARRSRRRQSGINIKPSHRGRFSRKGISVSQGLKSSNPKTRAQANFARMAKRGFKPLKSGSKSGGAKATRVKSHTRVSSTGKRHRVRAHRRSRGR